MLGECGISCYELNSGSDVAKEAGALSRHLVSFTIIYSNFKSASMILLNNDFSSIPAAIEIGRLVFENLRKVLLYLMPACNNSSPSILLMSNKNAGRNLCRVH